MLLLNHTMPPRRNLGGGGGLQGGFRGIPHGGNPGGSRGNPTVIQCIKKNTGRPRRAGSMHTLTLEAYTSEVGMFLSIEVLRFMQDHFSIFLFPIYIDMWSRFKSLYFLWVSALVTRFPGVAHVLTGFTLGR